MSSSEHISLGVDMLKKTVIFSAIIFLLSSCGAMQGKYSKVIFKHPETLDFKECEVDGVMTKNAYSKSDECIEKYKNMGYEVWGER